MILSQESRFGGGGAGGPISFFLQEASKEKHHVRLVLYSNIMPGCRMKSFFLVKCSLP